MREKYQRPEVKDLGTKWKMVYWDYSSKPRRKRSKVWGKQTASSKRDAQRLADQFMEKVNARNNGQVSISPMMKPWPRSSRNAAKRPGRI